MTTTATTKVCRKCDEEKTVHEFYGAERSYCKECERVDANKRMKKFAGTFRGKAMYALGDSRKARRKVEKEKGITIKDDLTLYDVLLILAENECAYCGQDTKQSDKTIDHCTSMRHGGDNTFQNIVMACRVCNSLKSDTPLLLHMLKYCDNYEVAKVLFALTARRQKPFDEVFADLTEDAKRFYDERTAILIARIEREKAEA